MNVHVSSLISEIFQGNHKIDVLEQVNSVAKKVGNLLAGSNSPVYCIAEIESIFNSIHINQRGLGFMPWTHINLWKHFCWGSPQMTKTHGSLYEFFSKEYIENLTQYLLTRAGELKPNGEKLVVVEVGAGNGLLTKYLQSSLYCQDAHEIEVVATDNKSWGIQPLADVERISHDGALSKYNPDIVIFSWPPRRRGVFRYEDIYFAIQQHPSVQEHIHIGPIATCGIQDVNYSLVVHECLDESLGKVISTTSHCGSRPWYTPQKRFSVTGIDLGPQFSAHQDLVTDGTRYTKDQYKSRTLSYRRIA